MSHKPSQRVLDALAQDIITLNRRRAETSPAPTDYSPKEPYMLVSGINPNDPQQVAVAERCAQDVRDLNKTRARKYRA